MNYSTKHKSISRFLSMVLAIAMVLTSSAFQAVEANASVRKSVIADTEAVVENEAVATEEVSEAVVEEVNEENAGKEETETGNIESIVYNGGGDPNRKIDVWAFDLRQLDSEKFNNIFTEEHKNNFVNAKADTKTDLGGGLYIYCQKQSYNKKGDGGELVDRYGFTDYDLQDILYMNSADAKAFTGDGKSRRFRFEGLEEGDVITVIEFSNGNNTKQIAFAPAEVEGKPDLVKLKDQMYTLDATKATECVFYAAEAGSYEMVLTDKVCTARIYREHMADASVTPVLKGGSAQYDGNVTYTNETTGKSYETAIGTPVTLKAGYKYKVAPSDSTYVVAESSLDLTTAPAEPVANELTFAAVDLVNVAGKIISVSGNELNAIIDKAEFKFSPVDNTKIYIPTLDFIKDGDNYTGEFTARFEKGVSYRLSLLDKTIDGKLQRVANDYTIENPTIDAFDVDTDNVEVSVVKATTVSVNIIPKDEEDSTLEFVAGDSIKFTNIGKPGSYGFDADKGYVYTFKGTDSIALRPGAYKVEFTLVNGWEQKLTTDIHVKNESVEKEVVFKVKPSERVWDFSSDAYTGQANFNGMELTNIFVHSNKATYGSCNSGGAGIYKIPVETNSDIDVRVGHAWDLSFEETSVTADSGNTNPVVSGGAANTPLNFSYTGGKGYITLKTSSSAQSYVKSITVTPKTGSDTKYAYVSKLTVDRTKTVSENNFHTVQAAVDYATNMERTADQRVTIMIAPGDYEEQLRINTPNVTLKNASAKPSIALKDKGVHIDENAVRITWYYGHGYNYYSMTTHHRYDPEILAANKENGYPSFENKGASSDDNSYWNASVSVMENGSGFNAEGIIFENSFNQYVSEASVNDVIVKKTDAKEETTAKRASMKTVGDTTVQQKGYVERAAAFAFYNNVKNVYFDNCKFIGRQDVFYGGRPGTAAFNKCEILGGTDYIMGGFTGIFNECILKMNTDDNTDAGVKNDVSYITAPQQTETRGYLFYNCTVTSAEPGVENGAQYRSKPGYWGRPWTGTDKDTGKGQSEALFVNTTVEATDAHWVDERGASLIDPKGWGDLSFGGSVYDAEYNTIDVVDNSSHRSEAPVPNGGVLKLGEDGKLMNSDREVTPEAYLGDWKPFGEDFALDFTPVVRTDVPTISENVMYMDPEEDAAPYVKTDEEGNTYYTEALKVFISGPTGAKIYYTTDGTVPTVDSKLYDPAKGAVVEPVKGRKEKIKLTAVAIEDGKIASDPVSASYIIADNSMIKKDIVIDISDGLKEDTVYGDEETISFTVGKNYSAGVPGGGWPVNNSDKATIDGIDYPCSVASKDNPRIKPDDSASGPTGSNIMNAGAYLEVVAKEAGTISLVAKGVNADKTFYFTEIDRVAGSAVTVTRLDGFSTGTIKLNLEKGKTYQIALKGSKIVLYGITLQYMTDPIPETEYPISFEQKTKLLDGKTDGFIPGVNYGISGIVDMYVGSNDVYSDSSRASGDKNKQEFKYSKAEGTIKVDGVEYPNTYIQGVDNPREKTDGTGGCTSDTAEKAVAKWGAYVEMKALKDCKVQYVIGSTGNSTKWAHVVEVNPEDKTPVLQSDGTYNVIEKGIASSANSAFSFELSAGKTYQVYVNGSKIKIFDIQVIYGDKVPKKWRAVEAPVIKGIKLSDDRNSYKVDVDGVVGNEGGDALKCYMVNKETGAKVEKISKAKDESAIFTFTPASSGNYEFYAVLERDGEEAKTSETIDPTAFDLAEMFDLQYTIPTINALTNKYDVKTNDARVEVSYDTVKEADYYTITVTNVSGNVIAKEDIEGSKATGVYLVKGLPLSESDEDIYTFKLEAISNKGEDRVPRTSSTKTIKIEALNVTTWASTTYGTSTTDPSTESGKKNNGSEVLNKYKNGELESVHVWSTGGKGKIVPASTDGLTFHYTKVDKNQNFTLAGDVFVNDWVYSNGQDGFGLMVSDRISKYDKNDSAVWNNSYQILCSLIEYRYNEEYDILTDAATDYKFNTRLGVLYRAKEGVTNADLPKISSGEIAAPVAWNYYGNALEASVGEKMAPILRAKGIDPKNTYDCNIIGNRTGSGLANADRLFTDFRMEIQRVDNAYVLRYVDILYDKDIEAGEGEDAVSFANPIVITSDGQKVAKYDKSSIIAKSYKEKQTDESGKEIEVTRTAYSLKAAHEGQLIPVIMDEKTGVITKELCEQVDGKWRIIEEELGTATTGKFGMKKIIDEDRQALTKLDAKNVYVGFMAARNGDMTASNIMFETPEDNSTSVYGYSYNAVAPDVEYIAPSYQTTTDTTRFANSDTSTVGFSANANGKLSIYDANGNVLVGGFDVKAGQTAYVSPKVKFGENKLTWSFTPASNYSAGENTEFLDYSTHTGEFYVYRANLGDNAGSVSENVIYVKQTVSENSINAIDYAKEYAKGTAPKGTKADPVDIFTAVSFATPGQTIKMAGGKYNMTEALEVPKFHRGTKTNMIKMMTDDESATRAVLDFKNIEVAADAFVIWSHYWYFEDFDVTNSMGEKKGIKIGGSYNVLDNLRAYNNSNSGFDNSRQGAKETRDEWPSYNLYLNCSSFANSDVKSEDGDGFAMKITCGKGNRCVGCIAAFNGDDGWDLYAKSETGCIEPVSVENSVAFANAYLISERGKDAGKDIWKFTGKTAKGPGNGNGFKMGGESLSGYHVLKNSVAFGNKADGITTNSCPDLQVENVTTYGNEGANLSLYTSKSALSTDFSLKGLISLKGGNDKIAGQNKQSLEKIFNTTNYYNAVKINEGQTGYKEGYDGITGTIPAAGSKKLTDADFQNVEYKAVIDAFVATTVDEAKFLSMDNCEKGITRDENNNISLGAKGDLFKLKTTGAAKEATDLAKAAGLENAGGADTISNYAISDVVEKVYEATVLADTVTTLGEIKIENIDPDLVGAQWLYKDTLVAPFAGSKASFVAVTEKGIERDVFINFIQVTGVEILDENGKAINAKETPLIVKDEPKKFIVKPVYAPANADIADVNEEVSPKASIQIDIKETTKLGVKITPAVITSFDNYNVEVAASDNASGIASITASMNYSYNSAKRKGNVSNVKKAAKISVITRTEKAVWFDNVKITDTCTDKTAIHCDGDINVSAIDRYYKLNVGEEFVLRNGETQIDSKNLNVKPVDATVIKLKNNVLTAVKPGTTTIAVSNKKDKTAVQYINVQVIDQPFTTNVATMVLDVNKMTGPEFKIIDIYDTIVSDNNVGVKVVSVDGSETEAAKFSVDHAGTGLNYRLNATGKDFKFKKSKFVFEMYDLSNPELKYGKTDETIVTITRSTPKAKCKMVKPINWFYSGDEANGEIEITSSSASIEAVVLDRNDYITSITPSATKKNIYDVKIKPGYKGQSMKPVNIQIMFTNYKDPKTLVGENYGIVTVPVKVKFAAPKIDLEIANKNIYKSIGQSAIGFKLYNKSDKVYITGTDVQVLFFEQGNSKFGTLPNGLISSEITGNEKLGFIKDTDVDDTKSDDSESVDMSTSNKGNIWTIDTEKMSDEVKNLKAGSSIKGTFNAYVKLSNWNVGIKVKSPLVIDNVSNKDNIRVFAGYSNNVVLAGNAGIAGNEIARADLKFTQSTTAKISDFNDGDIEIANIVPKGKTALKAAKANSEAADEADIIFDIEKNSDDGSFALTTKLKKQEKDYEKKVHQFDLTFKVNDVELSKPTTVKVDIRPVILTVKQIGHINILDRGADSSERFGISPYLPGLNYESIKDASLKSISGPGLSSDACNMFDVEYDNAMGRMFLYGKEDVDLIPTAKYKVYPSFIVAFENGEETVITSSKPVNVSMQVPGIFFDNTKLNAEIKLSDTRSDTMVTVVPTNDRYKLMNLELVNFKDNFDVSYDFDEASMKGTGALHIVTKDINGLKAGSRITLELKPTYASMPSGISVKNIKVNVQIYK